MNTGNFPKVYAPNKLRIVIIFIVLRSLLDVLQSRKGEKKISDLESWHKFEDNDYVCTAFQARVQAHKWRMHSHCRDAGLYSGTGLRWPLGTIREGSSSHTNPQLRAEGVPCSVGGQDCCAGPCPVLGVSRLSGDDAADRQSPSLQTGCVNRVNLTP